MKAPKQLSPQYFGSESPDWRGSRFLPAAILLWLALAMTAGAASYVVTNTADSGAGTLRAALAAANTAGGLNRITFNIAPSNTGTVFVRSTLPPIANNLTIDGSVNGAQITIDGQLNHILDVKAGRNVVIRKLTMQNASVFEAGATGGAMTNAGTLLLNGMTFENNVGFYSGGGALSNTGNLTVTNCTFASNRHQGPGGPAGGAINNVGRLVVTHCNFSNNDSGDDNGGAIFSSGTLTVDSSIFTGNAASLGGAIYSMGNAVVRRTSFFANLGDWGGAMAHSGNLSMTNCTFYLNQVSGLSGRGGGAIYSSGALTAIHCTFAANGDSGSGTGGALNLYYATATLENTLIVKGAGPNCVNNSSTLTVLNSIADDNTCGTATQFSDGAIKLGPYSDNGGPTPTMALLAGSVAVDAGAGGLGVTIDQRGMARPQGAGVDIGAFEWQSIPYFTQIKFPSAGKCSMQIAGLGANQAFMVLASTNLLNWFAVTNFVTGTNGLKQLVDSPGNSRGRLYRVKVVL